MEQVTAHKEMILSECAGMIRSNETEKLQLMFKLMDRVPSAEGIEPMLRDLESHIYEDGIADMVESAEVKYYYYIIINVLIIIFFLSGDNARL